MMMTMKTKMSEAKPIVVLPDVDVAVVVVAVEVVEEVTQMAAKVRQMEMPQLHDL